MSKYAYTKLARNQYSTAVGERHFLLHKMPCNGWRAECAETGQSGRGITRDLATADAVKHCERYDRGLAGPFATIYRTAPTLA